MSDAKSPLTRAQHDRRDRIIDAGLALLADRDYDKIQVKDVAEEANVALGTLYRYFSSKEHLFAEVLVRWAGTLRTNISRNPPSHNHASGVSGTSTGCFPSDRYHAAEENPFAEQQKK